ncbi:hypothetical protein KSP39_PZI002126 [Platanthera zijinensis]|uniref:Uncharacterized protein n=1 Tax=Platanthera zijinensis TaxID=2320716 RepID=A0AAP0GE54_9ASPA
MALEEMMYALVIQKFVESDVALILVISQPFKYVDRWSPKEEKLEQLNSLEGDDQESSYPRHIPALYPACGLRPKIHILGRVLDHQTAVQVGHPEVLVGFLPLWVISFACTPAGFTGSMSVLPPLPSASSASTRAEELTPPGSSTPACPLSKVDTHSSFPQ